MAEIKQLGRYKIETLLGSGAFAEVYIAVDPVLKRTVALKVLKPMLLADPEAFERFTREAQVAANLFHPNIATVLDMGEADGRCFIAMRYVEGQSLDKVISERGALPWEEALMITGQVARALDFAHARDLVHRDVKPQNILISQADGAVLTDFGLVKALQSSGMSSTTSMIGTPAYMAPEIWEGEEANPASDQYALACVMVEMLTGKALFDGTTATIMKKHLLETPALPENFSAGLPDGLQAVLLKALSKQSSGRFADLMDFLAALQELGKEEGPLSEKELAGVEIDFLPPEIPEELPNSKQEPALPEKIQEETPPKSSRISPWLAGAGGLGIAVILLITFLVRWISAIGTVTPQSTATTLPSSTVTSTVTPTVIFTSTVTATPLATATPEFGIGSTWLRPADNMTMMYVPAGKFTMGSDYGDSDEQPVHAVTLDAFWIDRTEVTNEMYARCVAEGACRPPSDTSSYYLSSYYGNSQYENYPVIFVDWNQAAAYCEWAGAELPSEAQWEKAARGTDGRTYPWGNSTADSSLANYNRNVFDTTEVGKYPEGASPYGALDMAGNVWEWVDDRYDAGYYNRSPGTNPTGPTSGDYRVLRGGSWIISEDSIRSANRNRDDPDYTYISIGFRCLRSP